MLLLLYDFNSPNDSTNTFVSFNGIIKGIGKSFLSILSSFKIFGDFSSFSSNLLVEMYKTGFLFDSRRVSLNNSIIL